MKDLTLFDCAALCDADSRCRGFNFKPSNGACRPMKVGSGSSELQFSEQDWRGGFVFYDRAVDTEGCSPEPTVPAGATAEGGAEPIVPPPTTPLQPATATAESPPAPCYTLSSRVGFVPAEFALHWTSGISLGRCAALCDGYSSCHGAQR